MSLITIIVIAVGLAMDAFAVSIATGATYEKSGNSHAFKMALAFGGFQAIMPVVGWLAGLTLKGFIRDYDHWIVFILLVFIGGKMIYESFKIKHAQKQTGTLSAAMLLVLAIATSIDALAVGITFSFLLAGAIFSKPASKLSEGWFWSVLEPKFFWNICFSGRSIDQS